MKRPRHRVFDYPPRHYKPEQDEQERRKRNLGFTSYRKYRVRKKNPIILLLFVFVIIYLILKLNGLV